LTGPSQPKGAIRGALGSTWQCQPPFSVVASPRAGSRTRHLARGEIRDSVVWHPRGRGNRHTALPTTATVGPKNKGLNTPRLAGTAIRVGARGLMQGIRSWIQPPCPYPVRTDPLLMGRPGEPGRGEAFGGHAAAWRHTILRMLRPNNNIEKIREIPNNWRNSRIGLGPVSNRP